MTELRVLGFGMGAFCWVASLLAVAYANVAGARWPLWFALFMASWGLIIIAGATLGADDDGD